MTNRNCLTCRFEPVWREWGRDTERGCCQSPIAVTCVVQELATFELFRKKHIEIIFADGTRTSFPDKLTCPAWQQKEGGE